MTSTSTIAALPSGQHAVIRPLENGDAHALHHYLQHLSELSKRRFGPHPFDESTVRSICDNLGNDECIRLCCFVQDRCIAYALLQPGILPPDAERYLSYGFEVGKYKYATYAPSVAEDYHGQGIAQLMFDTLQKKAVGLGADYIVLWGGVQQGNPRARRFYEKNGFIKIGSFDLNGGDDDMLKLVR